MNTSRSTINPVRKHRREIRNRIVLPVVLAFVALVGVCVIFIIAVAAGSMEATQITIIMSVVATIFIAIPLVILCAIPYVILALTAWGVGRIYAGARGPLGSVRSLTGQVATKTNEMAPRLARPTMALNIRLTRWEHTLRGWLLPAPEEELTDERHHPTS